MALYLDSDFRLLATELLGSLNLGRSGIKPMRIIGQAGRLGAMGFILVHHDSSRTAGAGLEERKATVELR